MVRNIEASVLIDLNLEDPDDIELTTDIFNTFNNLRNDYPQNVFAVNDETNLDEMVLHGLLEDEINTQAQIIGQARNNGVRAENRPRMRLHTRRIGTERRPRHATITGNDAFIPVINEQLLWKSNPLSRRDLNIPVGNNTNKTGSMLLKRGDPSQEINFQHYFRDEVFENANWVFDTNPRTAHIERANIQFRIIIRGIDFGVHTLEVSHNTNTESIQYRQRNGMTHIHWGEASGLISREDLLGCILYIFAPEQNTNIYTLNFDEE